MAIVKAPLKTDAAGKCTRWRIILYNNVTHKQEWHTVNGTRRDAEAFEREQETRLSKGTYVAKAERLTIAQIAASLLKECKARSRRTSTPPKTAAGNRTVALSGWLVNELHGADTDALVFATRTGRLMNPSNVRRDVWLKLVVRAGVRALDLYSLRHTFASLARVAGESAFNVARAMGHSRSTLVDQVYTHSLQSGMASVAERVTARALGEQPKLRVIEGGQRDVRQPLDESSVESSKKRATV